MDDSGPTRPPEVTQLPSLAWPDLRDAGLFGLIDGLNGAVGLVIGLLYLHAAAQIIFVALLSRAGSSSISMAGAEYESDETSPDQRVRIGRVAAMGGGYLTSALLPGLGFTVGTGVGLAIFAPAAVVILFAITWFRSGRVGWLRAAGTTMLIFGLAVLVGFLAGLVG